MEKKIADHRSEQVLSPWVTLVKHSVRLPGWKSPQDFHSLKQADYVAIFAVTKAGKIPLVRQYRSALGGFTYELPSGLRDAGEDPKETAIRELYEETGFVTSGEVALLGRLVPDSARLENHQWAFFSANVNRQNQRKWKPDPQVESVLVTRKEFKTLILSGEFKHALHLAVIGLAQLHGRFSL